jgi:NADH-quinone oxidoreductase subunit M
VKFFLYTMIASVFMLAAILWLYARVGTFDFVTIQNAIRGGQVAGFTSAAQWLFLDSSLHLRSRCRSSLFIPGCRMRT